MRRHRLDWMEARGGHMGRNVRLSESRAGGDFTVPVSPGLVPLVCRVLLGGIVCFQVEISGCCFPPKMSFPESFSPLLLRNALAFRLGRLAGWSAYAHQLSGRENLVTSGRSLMAVRTSGCQGVQSAYLQARVAYPPGVVRSFRRGEGVSS